MPEGDCRDGWQKVFGHRCTEIRAYFDILCYLFDLYSTIMRALQLNRRITTKESGTTSSGHRDSDVIWNARSWI